MTRRNERFKEEQPALLQLDLSEHPEHTATRLDVFVAPCGGVFKIGRQWRPVIDVDAVWNPIQLHVWIHRGDLPLLIATDDAHTNGVLDVGTTWREHGGVEVVASKQRDKRSPEPRRVDRPGKQRQYAAKCNDVRPRLALCIGFEEIPQTVESVRGIFSRRKSDVPPVALRLDAWIIEMAREVHDINL